MRDPRRPVGVLVLNQVSDPISEGEMGSDAPPGVGSSFIQRVSVGLNYSWSKGAGIWRRLSFRFRAVVLTIALGLLRSCLASVKP